MSKQAKYWKTHDHLHRAYTHLYEAIPHLFCYLNDPEIPATSNRLESFFKHLKEKLLLHSGLRVEAKRNFIKWYLHFKKQLIVISFLSHQGIPIVKVKGTHSGSLYYRISINLIA